MPIVQTGAPCSCENMAEPMKCNKCEVVSCFKCQVAYLVSAGYWETYKKIRCCPECYSDNIQRLNEPEISARQDRAHGLSVKSKASSISLYD